ncbi:MAG: tetratricopeptide repeat protein, partial [Spirochaetaceae bacterium]|nr:tetratricopeptide repeat protein [Spirochaetaceae bacterium]
LRPLVRFLLPVLSVFLLWGCSAESKRAKTLERAGQHFKAKEFEKARIEYQNVLQTDPNNAEANERMALIWLEQGSPVRAAAYLSKLRTIAPGNQEMRLKLARIILSLGGTAESRREAVSILERSTDFPDALVLLTETVRGPDDMKQAEQFLGRWPEKASVSYLLASANLMALRGDANGARTAYLRAITRDPKAVEARLAFANFLAGQNFPAEARDELKRAAEVSATDANTRLRYAAHLAQTGATAEAGAYLTEMTRQLPNFLPSWRALAELAIAARKFDEAQAHIQSLFAKDPADYEARLLRTRLWLAQGETKRAIDDLEKLGQEFPGLGIEKHQLALAHLQNNDGSAAIKALQEVVGRNPDNTDAQLQLAQLNLRA